MIAILHSDLCAFAVPLVFVACGWLARIIDALKRDDK